MSSSQEPFAVWLAELVHLTRVHGHATPQLWHEEVRPDLKRASAERQWERLKRFVVRAEIPCKIVPVVARRLAGNGNGFQHQHAIALVMEIGPLEVDRYAARHAELRKQYTWHSGPRKSRAQARQAVAA